LKGGFEDVVAAGQANRCVEAAALAAPAVRRLDDDDGLVSATSRAAGQETPAVADGSMLNNDALVFGSSLYN